MMKHEFEAIAKREVTDEQFEAIEKIIHEQHTQQTGFCEKHPSDAENNSGAGKGKEHQKDVCQRPEWLHENT